MHAELTLGMGLRCSKNRVARLMGLAGLEGVHRRKHRGMTRRRPGAPLRPDLVNREVCAPAPNRLWVADMTQHKKGEGGHCGDAGVDALSLRGAGRGMG